MSGVDFREMTLLRRELEAAHRLASALQALRETAPVDDDFPEVRHHYEAALAAHIEAMRINGRFKEGNYRGVVEKELPVFEREHRYIVLKVKDVNAALSEEEKRTLNHLTHALQAYRQSLGKVPLQCVVVEAHWPEYDKVWDMIERRVTGAPPGDE